ncbi:lysis protein [Pseudomonas sp. CNPSo 3701]|uniref:lysis protein n=1 Tax=Pseudomonas sp. CNPSo 3701 TaxID=3027943 RepID=UPI002364612A|nr:lysis protein [Pseudomonas sp. CNPSo 3701]MDD1510421.1 lysis protein [Pseudomonas sp. CNPSo 3701]
MSLLTLIPARYRWLVGGALALALLLGAISLGWVVQGWRLGQALAARDQSHAEAMARLYDAAARETQRAQNKRLAFEQQLQAFSQTQYRRLTNAEQQAARLRDRLATAELRLSVFTAEPAAADVDHHDQLPATTRAGRLVDGALRADIDRGAAQRIVDITGRGDRAIIALGTCQAYVRAISETL